ncbi:g3750 [Coccomyxa elongata]
METPAALVPLVEHLPTPHPNWLPESGEKQSMPYRDQPFKALDPAVWRHKLYPFCVTAVVPRPIALLSTLSKEGIGNLAPYSFFNIMSCDPPYVVIGALTTRGRPNEGIKDSHQNINETGEFVVNIVSHWMLEAANVTCGDFAHNESEWEAANLTPIPSLKVKPPRVAESAVHMECVLRHQYPIINAEGKTHAHILIGEVIMMHASEGVLGEDDKGRPCIDTEALAPISRLGNPRYGLTTATIDMEMPKHDTLT